MSFAYCICRKESLHICADFSTGLNNALESYSHPTPFPEDIFTILNGVFSQIDLIDAYHQIEVDKSRNLNNKYIIHS